MKNNICLVMLLSGSIISLHGNQAVPGTLDLSFGGSGIGYFSLDLGGNDRINSIAMDSERRIVAGGSVESGGDKDVLLMRFTPDGVLDTSFGGNGTGFTIIDFGGTEDEIFDLTIDGQGRIVASGSAGAADGAAVMRFTPDGLLDLSFGGNGTGFRSIVFGGSFDEFRSVLLDSEERIVAGGRAVDDILLMRFTPDGIPDTSFGGMGTGFNRVTIGVSFSLLHIIALDPQGRIVGGGRASTDMVGVADLVVIRFTPDGLIDTSFGGSGTGFNSIDFGSTDDRIVSLVLDPQERIVAGGIIGLDDGIIMRFTPDGLLDTSFGGGGTGFRIIELGGLVEFIFSIALDPRGKIVAGGQALMDVLIMRFTSNGNFDPTFGGNGDGINRISVTTDFDMLQSLLIDPQGRIVGGGQAGDFGTGDVLLMRFFGDPLTSLTTALREKYCGVISSND